MLRGETYRRDPAATWEVLMEAWKHNDAKIREVRESLDGRQIPLAMTECHFAIPGRNRCDVLSTWAAGVSYARILNNHQRHGDVLKIATAADFCGKRWQVNAVMIPTPHGQSYLMPVARVMKLYRHHIGSHAVEVKSCPGRFGRGGEPARQQAVLACGQYRADAERAGGSRRRGIGDRFGGEPRDRRSAGS